MVIVIIITIFVSRFGKTNVLMILVLCVVTKPRVVVEVLNTDAALDSGVFAGKRVMGLWVLLRVVGRGGRGCWRRVGILGRDVEGVLVLPLVDDVFGFIAGTLER